MFAGFSKKALACMDAANALAMQHRHTHISTEHVVLAIASIHDIGQEVLTFAGLSDPEPLKRIIFEMIPCGDTVSAPDTVLQPTNHLAHAIIFARGISNAREAKEVDTGDLLCGIAHEERCTALELLHHIDGVDINKIDNMDSTVATIRKDYVEPQTPVGATVGAEEDPE